MAAQIDTATTITMLFVSPRGVAQVYVPESPSWISLIVNRYRVALSSADQPVMYCRYQPVHVHSGVPFRRGYMQSR